MGTQVALIEKSAQWTLRKVRGLLNQTAQAQPSPLAFTLALSNGVVPLGDLSFLLCKIRRTLAPISQGAWEGWWYYVHAG